MAQNAVHRTPRQWRRWAGVWLVVAGLIAALGVVLLQSQQAGRHQLQDRFAVRAELASRFVSTYTLQVLDREQTLARTNLGSSAVTAADFQTLTASFGFQAAVLLDNKGRVLQVVPPDPTMIGQPIAQRYAHLQAAVDGTPSVSNVVSSAVEGAPVVAFAEPFDTPQGRRVFSGAYKVADTPLGAFLRDTISVKGTALYLTDPTTSVVASSQADAHDGQPISVVRPELAAASAQRERGHFQDKGTDSYFVRRPVAGTGWNLTIAIPSSALWAPLNSGRAVPWVIFFVLALLGATAAWMTLRLIENRERRTTEQSAALERERELVATLQQLSTAKNDFVHGVSHDLRTPLTSIMGFLEMLQDGDAGPLEPQQADMVDAVARNAKRLAVLVEDLLDAARLDPTTVANDTELVSMASLLSDVAADIEGLSAGRRLVFHADIPPQLGVVMGQRSQLERVVLNLLSNAIKFTPDDGTVVLAASVLGRVLTIEIRDTGMGIDEHDQARLFQPFFRAAHSRDHVSGTGLGLAVVAGIVAQHSGSIEVESTLGHGTTMRVRLPLSPDRATTVSSRA